MYSSNGEVCKIILDKSSYLSWTSASLFGANYFEVTRHVACRLFSQRKSPAVIPAIGRYLSVPCNASEVDIIRHVFS